MNIGYLWWNRLINSVRFLDDASDIILDGNSIIMNFPNNTTPWFDIMISELEEKISSMFAERLFKICDVSENKEKPGKYLLDHFCSQSERDKYWPSMRYEEFLATNNNTTLNNSIVCITGIKPGYAVAWQNSISEYLKSRNSEERGIFIIIINNANISGTGLLKNIKYSDYVTAYDSLMLCMTVLSSEKLNTLQKQYIAEIADNISGENIEIAGILSEEGITLAENPIDTAKRIFNENNIKVTNLDNYVKSAIWDAQIKLVFPQLENLRRKMIIDYKDSIDNHLPVSIVNGEYIREASDLEIGQLYYICRNSKIMDKKDFDILCKMRNARNKLAHRNILTYDELSELEIF